jgi:hypothetical protein
MRSPGRIVVAHAARAGGDREAPLSLSRNRLRRMRRLISLAAILPLGAALNHAPPCGELNHGRTR